MSNTLSYGDRSAAVATLQRRLNASAALVVALAVDGIYGEATESAVRTFQTARGLVADGIAGPRTQITLLGGTVAHALTQADIETAAEQLGCDVPALQAIVEVESGASGYLPDGRVDILFERHIMWQRLEAAGIDPEPWAAKYPNVVNRAPGGYHGGEAEYVRLATAQTIDIDCAYESASWGRFQLMGWHWQALGYTSARAFVQAMQSGERAQLDAFVRFVRADSTLHAALVEHDWPAFAEAYNGPAYARHLYDVRLARAWRRHGGIDDISTTATQADTQPSPRRRRKAAAPAD